MDTNDSNGIVELSQNDNELNLNTNRCTTQRKLQYVIEPAVFLIFFSMNLSDAVFQNQVLYQACMNPFGYDKSECLLLGTENATQKIKDIETEVEPYAAKIFMTRTLFESIIPAITSLFIGPWSDKFGRKPVILVSFLGYCSVYILISVIVYISNIYSINPWIYTLAIIPVSITGGNCTLIMGIFCYTADVTNYRNRPTRMAFLEASLYLGLLVGSTASSYILHATNAEVVFIISAVSAITAILYIIFVNKESRHPYHLDIAGTSKLRELFKWELVKDMFSTCFERRPNFDRAVVWLTILTLGIGIFVMQGIGNVFFLFVREKFSWSVRDFTLYEAGNIIWQIFGNVFVMFLLQKWLGFSVTIMGLLAMSSCTLDSVTKAAASKTWHLYLAVGLSLFKGLAGPACRSILSEVVPPSDIGKVYSLATSIESISPLISAPLYTYVYSLTLKSYVGAFNWISAGLHFMCFCFLSVVFTFELEYPRTTYRSLVD